VVSVPPLELIASAWLPYITGFVQRANALLYYAPGLTPTSWWRSPDQNRAAGGDDESQHLFAIGMDAAGSKDAVRRAMIVAPQLGLIPVAEPGYVHVQLFPRGALARVGVTFPR